MPGYFPSSGYVNATRQDVVVGLTDFVTKVLDWCQGLNDRRVTNLVEDWTAISNATPDEVAFCEAAGRMGLDPYEIEDETLVDLLANELGNRIKDPLIRDLLESSEPAAASGVWNWVSGTETAFQLTGRQVNRVNSDGDFRTAKDQGYYVARRVRELVQLGADTPVDDVGRLTHTLTGLSLSFEDRNHLPSSRILGAVGWRGAEAIIAGPRKADPNNQRFLESRGLYQAIVGCQRGARLLTKAHTWNQQATRAFAAELLAPQKALAPEASPDMEPDERSQLQMDLSNKYRVSPEVIRLQLQNADAWRESEE
jgi:hypothetical protein